MINKAVKVRACLNFAKGYKEFLAKYVYRNESDVRKIFKGKLPEAALNMVIVEYMNAAIRFYERYPYGSYIEEINYIFRDKAFLKSLSDYKRYVGDDRLLGYLHVYAYCIEELYHVICEEDGTVKLDIEVHNRRGRLNYTPTEYFGKIIHSYAEGMYRHVSKDFANGNYWWLKDNATTLRRQLNESLVYINTDRVRSMFRKYLGKEISDQDFLEILNKPRESGLLECARQLDKKMAEKHDAKPYFCWYTKSNEGENILNLSEKQPPAGVYAFVEYHTEAEIKNQRLGRESL